MIKEENKELPTVEEIIAFRNYLKYLCETLKLDFTANEKTFDQLIKEIKNRQLDS